MSFFSAPQLRRIAGADNPLRATDLIRFPIVPVSLFFALSAIISCSDTAAPSFEPCPGDTVTMNVRTDVPPWFSWSPACGVAFLAVYPEAGGSNVWTVYADSGTGPENPIASGVRYGVTPARAQTVAGPETLQSGTRYVARISRLLCDQGLCYLQDTGHVVFQR